MQTETKDRAATESTIDVWYLFRVLYGRRYFIVTVTAAVAILSIVVSLLLPKWYQSSTRLLIPESGPGGSLSAALLGDISSAAKSFLGSTVGEYTRYIAILTSRSVMERVADEFNLLEVYELEESPSPREDVVEMLRQNTRITVDDRYEFLSISVLDKDRQRAADMANFMAAELNRVNARLSSLNAAGFRGYVERRYELARAEHDSLLAMIQRFQEEYGVYDITIQTEAFFGQVAEMRGRALEMEIQHEALRLDLGPENPRVRSLENAVRSARVKYWQLLSGTERLFPVAQDSMPQVVRKYAELELQRLIQERILEVVAPVLEQARFGERRETEAVQIVDAAVPAERKAKPQRSVIVVASTLSAFILALVFVLLLDWWSRNYRIAWSRIVAPNQASSGGHGHADR